MPPHCPCVIPSVAEGPRIFLDAGFGATQPRRDRIAFRVILSAAKDLARQRVAYSMDGAAVFCVAKDPGSLGYGSLRSG